MSVSRRFMTEKITFWVEQSKGSGQYADSTWSRTETKCTQSEGGDTQTDDTGAEFKPSSTIWTAVRIPRGAKVINGWVTDAKPPAGSDTVRQVETHTPLRGAGRDYVAYTG